MPPKIADIFGEEIGMIRSDIRKLAQNLTDQDADRLSRENRGFQAACEHDIPPYPVANDMAFFSREIKQIMNACVP